MKPLQLWNLVYNGQVLVRNQPWPVLVIKQKQLVASGTYTDWSKFKKVRAS